MFDKYIDSHKNKLHDIAMLGASNHHGGVGFDFFIEKRFLPEAYRQYFIAEIDWRLHEFRMELSDNSRFQIASAESSGVSQIISTLKSFAYFRFDDVVSIIEAAVEARINLLCRPRLALKWFIFRGQPALSSREVLLRLNYFSDYRYLLDKILIYIQNKSENELITETEFMNIVEDIDNNYILDLTPRQFVDVLAPLFDFFSIENSDDKSIPAEALIIFLDDKHVEPIAQELERAYFDDNCKVVTENIFLEIVTNILNAIDDERSEKNESDSQNNDAENKAADIVDYASNTIFPSPPSSAEANDALYATKHSFLAAPGEYAATIAMNEFITPEFGQQRAIDGFTFNFAPEIASSGNDSNDAISDQSELPKEFPYASGILNDEFKDEADIDKPSEQSVVFNGEPAKTIEPRQYADVDAMIDDQEILENTEVVEEDVVAMNDALGETHHSIQDNRNAEFISGHLSDDENKDEFIDEEIIKLSDENKSLNEELADGSIFNNNNYIKFPEDADNITNTNNDITANEDAPDLVGAKVEQYKITIDIPDDIGKNDNERIERDDVSVNEPATFADDANDLRQEEYEAASSHIAKTKRDGDFAKHAPELNNAEEQATNQLNESPVSQKSAILEADDIKSPTFPTITSLLGNKRERYIKKLFNKNEEEFKAFATKIDAAGSWKDAAQIFDYFLIANDISLDNSIAAELRGAIKSRYAE